MLFEVGMGAASATTTRAMIIHTLPTIPTTAAAAAAARESQFYPTMMCCEMFSRRHGVVMLMVEHR